MVEEIDAEGQRAKEQHRFLYASFAGQGGPGKEMPDQKEQGPGQKIIIFLNELLRIFSKTLSLEIRKDHRIYYGKQQYRKKQPLLLSG